MDLDSESESNMLGSSGSNLSSAFMVVGAQGKDCGVTLHRGGEEAGTGAESSVYPTMPLGRACESCDQVSKGYAPLPPQPPTSDQAFSFQRASTALCILWQ